MSGIRIAAAALAAAGIVLIADGANAAERGLSDCHAQSEFAQLARPLGRMADRLRRRLPITILAIGSSSTAGYGASSEEATYPKRLELELRIRYPGAAVRVVNRGVNGEDAREMVARFDRELGESKPDVVLWQVGTNALLRDAGVDPQASLIRDGLRRIRSAGADAVLIDPQYAPKVLRDPDARPMVALLAKIASEEDVPVFRRFALMQYWHEARELPFADMLSPDLFHMNDWSYGCFAKNLAAAIAGSVPPPTIDTADAEPESSPSPVIAASARR